MAVRGRQQEPHPDPSHQRFAMVATAVVELRSTTTRDRLPVRTSPDVEDAAEIQQMLQPTEMNNATIETGTSLERAGRRRRQLRKLRHGQRRCTAEFTRSLESECSRRGSLDATVYVTVMPTDNAGPAGSMAFRYPNGRANSAALTTRSVQRM